MRNGRLLIVGMVFLASLIALVASAGLALFGTTDQLAVRDELRSAAVELAAAAREPVEKIPLVPTGSVLPESDNRRLAEIVRRVLAGYPGFEGGFYMARSDQFVGTAMTGSHAPDEPVIGERQGGKKDADKKMPGKNEADRKESAAGSLASRRDPPPLETPSIRQHCREAVNSDPAAPPVVEIRDVGPSRVAVATVAVSEDRPARVAVWVLIRLTGPQQQNARLVQLQIATAIAFLGVLSALGLSIWLIQSLRREQLRRGRLSDELRKSEHLASLGRLLAGVGGENRLVLADIRIVGLAGFVLAYALTNTIRPDRAALEEATKD